MIYLALLVILAGILFGGMKIWDKIVFKKVKINIEVEENRVFAGDDVSILTKIENKKLIPLPFIEMKFGIPKEFLIKNEKNLEKTNVDNYIYRVVSSLLFFERLRRRDVFRTTKRGCYVINKCDIKLGDFLGYVDSEKSIYINKFIMVYPKIKELDHYLIMPQNPQGDVSVKRWILADPIQTIGSRKYTSRDSFNSIDWKATAKLGELYVKKYDYTSNPAIMVLLDVQTREVYWKDIDEEIIEKGIEIAGALTRQALKEKVSVGFSANCVFENETQDVFVEPKVTDKQEKKVLEALAKVTYRRTYSMDNFITAKNQSLPIDYTLIFLTAYLSNDFKYKINMLSTKGYNIKLILLSNNVNKIGLKKNIEVIKMVDANSHDDEEASAYV